MIVLRNIPHILRNYLMLTALLSISIISPAQHMILLTPGSTTVNVCDYPDGIIYDNGGATGNYTNSFDGYVTLYSQQGMPITLSGWYNTESSFDKISVYDGMGTTGNLLVNQVSGIDSLTVTSTTGYLTLYFSSDRVENAPGFAFTYHHNDSSCTNKPSNITFSDIGTNSATISWTSDNPSGAYLVSIGGQIFTTYGNSFHATGLQQLTPQDVWVSSVADSLSNCCSVKSLFYTRCASISEASLPFHYGFESTTNNGTPMLDPCWRIDGGPSGRSLVTSNHPHRGNASLYMANDTDYVVVVMPEYTDSLNRIMLDFWTLNSASNTAGFVDVGVMDNPFALETFVLVETVRLTGNRYQHHAITFDQFTGTGHYIALRIRDNQESYIDDVRLRLISDCPVVENIRILGQSGNYMAVGWDARGNSAQDLTFTVTAIGVNNGDTITTTVLHSPAIISGTTAEEPYNIVVTPSCDSTGINSLTLDEILSGCNDMTNTNASGTDNTLAWGVPVFENGGNSFCQFILTPNDLSAMGVEQGFIYGITFNWSVNNYSHKRFDIFLSNSLATNYNSTNTPITYGIIQVLSGIHPLYAVGEVYYQFDTPFYWDGTSSIVVTTIMNQPEGEPQDNTFFYGTSSFCNNQLTLHCHRDSAAYRTRELSSLSCTRSAFRPEIRFSQCSNSYSCMGPMLVVDTIGDDCIGLAWPRARYEGGWAIAYKPLSSETWIVLDTNYLDTTYLFTQLEPGVTYDFRVTSHCTTGLESSNIQAYIPCVGSRFEYDNLAASNVTCTYGTYSNPYQHSGVIDHGHLMSQSRHTIHTDKFETDPRTGYRLNTVPDGYCSSVRLGNWLLGREAESISYNYTVDTTFENILLLKYATVIQNATTHPESDQPRFKFTIADANGQPLDQCLDMTYNSSNIDHWYIQDETIWTKWKTVGVDLRPFHGQTITIKLETADCNQGAHYGYAYFVLDLENLRIRTSGCSPDSNTLYAPEGFTYKWYYGEQPDEVLSTADTLVAYNAGIYYCDLKFLGTPNSPDYADCHVTLSFETGNRYPFARFSLIQTDTTNCHANHVTLENRSIVTRDYEHNDSIDNVCDNYLWTIDDTLTTTATNPTLLLDGGVHTVQFYAMLGDGNCVDTCADTIIVFAPCVMLDSLTHQMCEQDTFRIYDTILCHSGRYILDSIGNEDTVWVMIVNLQTQGTYRDTTASYACDQYIWNGISYTSSGIYPDTLWHGNYCDSIQYLDLTIYPSYNLNKYDTICQGQIYIFGHRVIREEGLYHDTLSTNSIPACDSLVTLNLKVNETYALTYADTMYYGDTITIMGTVYTEPGQYYYNYPTIHGCDSLITVNIYGRRLVDAYVTDTFCMGDTLHFREFSITRPGTYIDTAFSHIASIADTLLHLTAVEVPLMNVTFDTTRYCGNNAHVRLVANTTAPYTLWESSPRDSHIANHEHDKSINVYPDTNTMYTLWADYRSKPLCRSRYSMEISPIKNVKAIIDAHPAAISIDQRKVTANNNSQGEISHHLWYVWYNESSPWTSNDEQLILYVPEQTNTLKIGLTVRNSECSDTDQVEIDILQSNLSFPNVFTPSQRTNNIFKGVGAGITQFELWIYDRRGNLVYHGENINEGWDGTCRGIECPQNTYVYKCRYVARETPGGTLVKTGTITLIR